MQEIHGSLSEYIKQILKLEQTTSTYLLRLETGKEKLANKTRKRAIRYEDKVQREVSELIKECIKVKDRLQNDIGPYGSKKTKEKWKKEIMKYIQEKRMNVGKL